MRRRASGDERPLENFGNSSTEASLIGSLTREGTSTKAKGDDAALSKLRLALFFCAPRAALIPQ